MPLKPLFSITNRLSSISDLGIKPPILTREESGTSCSTNYSNLSADKI